MERENLNMDVGLVKSHSTLKFSVSVVDTLTRAYGG